MVLLVVVSLILLVLVMLIAVDDDDDEDDGPFVVSGSSRFNPFFLANSCSNTANKR